MKRILVVAPSWVGDTVLAQPLLMRLKDRFEDAVIDVLAPPWTAPLFDRMSEVHRVIENPFRHRELKLAARYRLGKALAKGNYDQAIVLPNSLKSALSPFFAGIPRRTGFVGEMRRGILNDARTLDKTRYPLMVERFCLLAEEKGEPLHRPLHRPKLEVPEEKRRAALEKFGISADRLAVFCPGAEYGPAKRWPAAHFAALAKMLGDRYRIVALGSAKDREFGEEVARQSGGACTNLCGESALSEAVDLISAAKLVVSNDSGLMHVAAALDRPLIALYGSSSPGFTPPLSEKAQVLKIEMTCSPCFERECPLGHFDCMVGLAPETVFEKILAIE